MLSDLSRLDAQKEVEIGTTYHNRKQAQKFVGYIAQAEREQMIAAFEDVSFMAILSDGSTDSAVMEEEIIYIRYARAGVVQMQFVGIQCVPKANAENIAGAITTTIETRLNVEGDVWRRKLVAICSDGASVMTGCKTGVVVRLSKNLPGVIAMHCMAHRLELSYKDAGNNTCHKKVDILLMGLYYFYHNSPLNRENLKASYKILGMKVLLPTRVGGTRWVGHLQLALDHFLRGYAAIMQHLEQIQSPDAEGVKGEQQAKARNFFNTMRSLSVIYYAHFLYDVLVHLQALSAKLQTNTITIASVQCAMEATTTVLRKYKSQAGPQLLKVVDTDELHGTELIGNDSSFTASRKRLLEGLLVSLNRRFSDLSSGILQATHITEFSSWPDKTNMEAFGDDEITTLVQHFQAVLVNSDTVPDRILEEWTILKFKIYNCKQWCEALKKITWSEVNRKYKEDCPNLLTLVDLLLTIPASTAECERGFNLMKQIKNDWRCALANNTLNDLMTILLYGANVGSYNPARAVELWLADGARRKRPDFMEGKIQVLSDDSGDEEDHGLAKLAEIAYDQEYLKVLSDDV